MILTNIFINLFGKTELFGLNMGFWVSMAAVLLIVAAMNILFWCLKPTQK
ncbi:MAG: hypothetical protein LIO87_04225 [Eubacterium sp.]|nr:hypothetical protein [Eubacterium sp.]